MKGSSIIRSGAVERENANPVRKMGKLATEIGADRSSLGTVGVLVAVKLQHAGPSEAIELTDGLHEHGTKLLSGGWREVDARGQHRAGRVLDGRRRKAALRSATNAIADRKSTRLNSSHLGI